MMNTPQTHTAVAFDAISDQPKPIRLVAKALSYLFHPLFIPALAAWMIIWLQPINALLISDVNKPRMMAMVLLYTAMFPAFSVFLLWRLKFVDNIYLRTQRERIIPYVIAGFFYFWMYYVSRNLEAFPVGLKQFLLGVFISSSSALFANIYTKISMHSIGVGGLVAWCHIQQFNDPYWNGTWSLIALVVAGAVCTSRLILKAHRPVDVYAGVLIGVISQVLASFIIGG